MRLFRNMRRWTSRCLVWWSGITSIIRCMSFMFYSNLIEFWIFFDFIWPWLWNCRLRL
jgi:hypothetical protein